jgi:hypothetical protein
LLPKQPNLYFWLPEKHNPRRKTTFTNTFLGDTYIVQAAQISEYVGLGIQENGEYCRNGGGVAGCYNPGILFYFCSPFVYSILVSLCM